MQGRQMCRARCALSQGGRHGRGTGLCPCGPWVPPPPAALTALATRVHAGRYIARPGFLGFFFSPPPKTSPALSRHPHLPGEGGEILPFPQRVELFPLQQPAVFTANIAQGFGSLASPECKTFSHRNIFFMQGKRSLSNKKHFS